MIEISKATLPNGLQLVHHADYSTQMVALNVLYKVGSRNETPDRTGFAHLFEHLMFGGSANIPDYDTPLQLAGGENNAWTNADITNYYLSVPKQNVETGFWLESDRMLQLAFSKKNLDVQKKVVIEEFKQRNLNQPYGDVSHLLLDMVYKVHPYRWPTIGLTPTHIKEASLQDVKDFFHKHYAPNNAILAISGNIAFDEALELTTKWFGEIPKRVLDRTTIAQEPPQTEARFIEVERDVAQNVLYRAYRMCDRLHPDYHVYDLLSDLLSSGNSSRLYRRLVMEQKIFSSVNAFISGDTDSGLFRFTCKLHKNVTFEMAELALQHEIDDIVENGITSYELEKVKNKAESQQLFSEINFLNKAMNIAYFEFLGDALMINNEVSCYLSITKEDIQRVAKQTFVATNCSTIHYKSTQKK